MRFRIHHVYSSTGMFEMDFLQEMIQDGFAHWILFTSWLLMILVLMEIIGNKKIVLLLV